MSPLRRPPLSVSSSVIVLSFTICGSIWLHNYRNQDVEVVAAARDLQPYEQLDATASTVVRRPRSSHYDATPQQDGSAVVIEPVPHGSTIESTADARSAVAARPGDLVLRLPLAADEPVRQLLRPGFTVNVLASPSSEDTVRSGQDLKDVLVVSLEPSSVTLSVPARYGDDLATLGTERITFAIPSG